LTDNIAWFKELNNKDVATAGGKGASLGEMYNAGFPIPPGFAVTAQAFGDFLIATGLKDKIHEILINTKVDDTKQLQDNAKKIKSLILKEKMSSELMKDIMEAYEDLNIDEESLKKADHVLDIAKGNKQNPPFVAVRSSATAEDLPEASFAGQQETFLNIKGNENLVKTVKKCWASLYTPRAIFYREKNHFPHEKVLISVIIQKMVNSQKAGVMFSVNVNTNKKDEIQIEAAFGLGEFVVGGKVNPDLYILDKESLEIKTKKISRKKIGMFRDEKTGENYTKKLDEETQQQQVLSKAEINELGTLAKKSEDHYQKPQDMEFAIENNQVYIVQSRPVTTLKDEVKDSNLKGEVLTQGLAASPGIGIGTVKIVTEENMHNFKEGEVLVTEMTNPTMVPIMQKSVAIVTNEGGTTCFEGSTKVLTTKGFLEIREVTRRVKEGENFNILAYDIKKLKPRWKKVISAGSRISKTIRVSTSQTGRMESNYLDLTEDHKMFTFKNRNLVKKEIRNVLDQNEALCLIDSLPKNEKFTNYKLAYLIGAILSDGYVQVSNHHTGNPRRGRIVLTQKNEEYRKDFIETYQNYFHQVFGEELTEREKSSSGYIRGRLVQGTASNFICTKLEPTLMITKVIENLNEWSLQLDEHSSLNFLAGLIDGDGSFHNNRIQIYINKEHVLQATILNCLKLGILPQVTSNRHIHNVQILERMEDILEFSNKIKDKPQDKILGTKLFAAKQILGDIVDDVNWLGKIKPYVKNNLLLDSRKIQERILSMASPKNKEELIKILNSSIRMHRVNEIQKFGETEVFNLEIEANNELDHNYIVFTKKYTPLLVSNSHAAIVGRELGKPVIVGTENATKVLNNNLIVTVDGVSGKVFKGEIKGAKTKKIELDKGEGIETKTKIYMNLAEPSKIDEYKDLNFDGIGLMRVEFIIAGEIAAHPLHLIKEGKQNFYVEKLKEGIGKIAKTIAPKPVIVRFSDFKTNEYHDLKGGDEFEPKEDNPMIGWRGVSRYVSEEFIEAFKLECQAIKELREETKNVHVMLPFVRNIDEVKKCLEILKEQGLERNEDFKILLMAEVPAMAIIPEDFASLDIDGTSIGSNDLTQLVLGVDRDSKLLGKMGYFDERNKGVLTAIKNIIKGFKKHNKTVSICGQAPSVYPEVTEFLVKEGITSISVNPDVVGKTRRLVKEKEEQ
jgi:pyruvate, water dikinase